MAEEISVTLPIVQAPPGQARAGKASAVVRCRVCWQVTVFVFLSILAVEAAILVPSYLRRESNLLHDLEARSLTILAASLHWQEKADGVPPQMDNEALALLYPLVGLSLMSPVGDPVGRYGELPDLDPGALLAAGNEKQRLEKGARYLVLWTSEDLGAPYMALAYLDSGNINNDLSAFIWRIVGLTLLITLVVCGATMAVLSRLIFRPVLALRSHLLAARARPDKADSYMVENRFGHELGEMTDAFNALVKDLSAQYRRDLQDSEQRFEDFAKSASDWYWEMDHELRFSYFSERFTDITGVEPEALLGKTRQETGIPDVDPEAWQEHLATLAAHRPFRNFVHPRVKQDGSRVWLSINGQPHFDRDGQFAGYRGTGSDVTSLKQAQEELRIEKDKAEVANRAKSEFLANMSHEIRTPMTAVIGMSEILLEGSLSECQRDKVQTINDSGQSLLEIINEILDLSRLEAGKLDLEMQDTDLQGLLKSLEELMTARAAPKGLALVVQVADDLPTWVRADGLRIRQVLINLVENAIKFSDNGEVRLSVRSQPQGDGKLLLSFLVEDQGIGIPSEDLERLFDKFEQADSSTNRSFGGSGLGLAICKQLVERMGGQIGAESEVGKGSRFWFELTLQECAATPHQDEKVVEAAPLPELRPLKILLAEDNAINQALICRLLQPFGHELTVAGDGREAFETAQREAFDVILMDVRMPNVDGVEATRMIRETDGPNRGVPIIAVTADAMVDNERSFLEAGMDAVTTKPIDLARLLGTIARLVPSPSPSQAAE